MGQSPDYLPQVREQYEEFPYPLRNPADEKLRLVAPILSRLDMVSHHCFGGQQDFNDFRVLIAGGGTGDVTLLWAEQLRERKNTEVVYLDLSSTSMKIAQERARIRKLDNIQWVNESLLNLPKLGLGRFDFVSCTGVLHHLADPDAGLKALQTMLKPDGAMEIMVYAPYGRTPIYPLQALMRQVNAGEDRAWKKIENTKAVLQSLPPYNLFNIMQKFGWSYQDAQNDAGIYDLFLHSQDRAYTILEAHEWLERCGLKLTSEPGTRYTQAHYCPETFIKDPDFLAQIMKLPLKNRQFIAESMSNKITMHELYVTHAAREDRTASLDDSEMIVDMGMFFEAPFAQLATIADQRKAEFTITVDNHPAKPMLTIPQGKHVPAILRQIDGKKTVGEIMSALKTFGPEQEIRAEFERVFTNLNRAHMLFLRHNSVAPYPTLVSYENRVRKLYA